MFCSVQISTKDQSDLLEHFRMCAALICVNFCSSMADRWSASNWRLWYNPFLIVPNAPNTTGTIFVLTFHTLLTSISRFLYLLSFSVSSVLWFVLLTQYCAGDKIEKNEMGWACGAYGWGEGVCRVLVEKPEGRRPLGRPRRRWVDNIRLDLQ